MLEVHGARQKVQLVKKMAKVDVDDVLVPEDVLLVGLEENLIQQNYGGLPLASLFTL